MCKHSQAAREPSTAFEQLCLILLIMPPAGASSRCGWLPREIKKKRSKALLQICSAWGPDGVAQHSSALVASSRGAPLARAASQGSVGPGAAGGLRKRAGMQGFQQRKEICVFAGQRISDTKGKGKIQQHNRGRVEKGRTARRLQKEGILGERQVLLGGKGV